MKITEHKKKDGTIVYRANIYLGIDQVTGKDVKTSITARTRKELKQKIKDTEKDNGFIGATSHLTDVDVSTITSIIAKMNKKL